MTTFGTLLGANLKALRKRLGVTQAQLAEALNLAPTYFGRVETGEFFPSLEVLDKVAIFFDIPANALFLESEAISEALSDSSTPTIFLRVGQNISNRRKEIGLTQAQLGKLTGLTQTSMARIEGGHVSPRTANLEIIAKHLKCTVDELFEVQPVTPVTVKDMWIEMLSRIKELEELTAKQTVDYDTLHAEKEKFRLALERQLSWRTHNPPSESSESSGFIPDSKPSTKRKR